MENYLIKFEVDIDNFKAECYYKITLSEIFSVMEDIKGKPIKYMIYAYKVVCDMA